MNICCEKSHLSKIFKVDQETEQFENTHWIIESNKILLGDKTNP